MSTLLVVINASLILLAVSGISLAAVGLLRQLADEQALARVRQAGQSARQELRASQDSLLTTTRLLAERPTLLRLLRADDQVELTAFLSRFQQTGGLGACAVIRDGQVVVRTGAAMDWAALAARAQADPSPAAGIAREAPPALVAWAPVPELEGALVLTARPLETLLAEEIGPRVGLPVALLPSALPGPADSPAGLAALAELALAQDEPAAARLDADGRYLAVAALPREPGQPPALLEVSLPTTGADASLMRLFESLLLLALAVTVLAVLVNLVIGRRLGAPLLALSDAAAGIGRGDLATPILPAQGAEIGALAGALEEMRGQLLRLTTDLRRQRAEADAILTGIVEGVFTVDRERRVRYMNPQAAELLGLRAEETLGQFCGDVLYGRGAADRPCETDCPILQARFRGNARATEHIQLANGQSRTVIITSAAPAEGQQVQVMRDETELEATRRLRDAVLANISHEFRTPLSAQLASIELLLDRLPDLTIDELGHLVLSLQRGTLRLTRLIDNLLESVRIESGQDSIRRRPVSMDEVVEEAVELTRPLLNQRGQDVAIDLPYPLPSVNGDARRLTQVFVNLLANANKFAPVGSTITIGGVVQDDSIALWVEDRGPGLPPMAGQSLFERFVRSPVEEPEQNGMGLGLWIVKSIIERHGGLVGAQSSAVGTQMYVILPRGREQADEDTRGG
ncbi:MAG TPA: ATP-binding protein [Roseiflexaceae bacterium]|nr:ATP-binding protein [Roseiflexaceae bacterium]